MAIHTGITWANSTWNPWMGCHKVSLGCKNCYMFRDTKRYGKDPNIVRRASDSTFSYPLKWKKSGSLPPESRIFVCSWSDFFIKEADPWRDEAWNIIRECPEFNFLILTKRIERASGALPLDWGRGWSNVWLGISAEDTHSLLARLPILNSIPAKIKWISAEPLLDFIRLPDKCEVDWIVSGGESDPTNPRVVPWYYFDHLRQQCIARGIKYFHKQNGGSQRINGVWGSDSYNGAVYHEFPR